MDEATVDRLASIAQQLAGRVRDDDPVANARWLAAVTTAEEREALLYVLAAAVPDDRTWDELTGWAHHGTARAAARHEQRGEHWCDACKAWAAEPLSTRSSTGRSKAA